MNRTMTCPVSPDRLPRRAASRGLPPVGHDRDPDATASIAVSFPVASLANDDFLRTLVDTVPDAMIVIDEDGRILSFSRTAEATFGYRANELVGENVAALMPSPDREQHDAYIRRYLETGERRIIGIGRVTTARRRNGDSFPVDLKIGEATIDGRPVFIGFVHDLSTHENVRQRLHIVQAELARVARISSMGMLASAIAHELNQPLAAIASYAETAHALVGSGGEDRAAIQDAMRHCSEEALRAGEIIRRLRDFLSRGDVERVATGLQTLIGQAVALALADGEGAGVGLEFSYDPAADLVFADRLQVQQVVLNLIRNAMEAMQGQPSRSIAIETRTRQAGLAEVVISDSGPGIEPHIAGRLFQPFQSSKASGMGMGLSISHTIVDGHGGRIWVEPSRLGGTAFHFTLPLAQGPPVDTERPS
jgi:two-component system sensor kinase FixL